MEELLVFAIVLLAFFFVIRHMKRLLTVGEGKGCEKCALNEMMIKNQKKPAGWNASSGSISKKFHLRNLF